MLLRKTKMGITKFTFSPQKNEGEISGFFSPNEYMYLGRIGKQNPMGY